MNEIACTEWLDHRTGIQTAVRQFLYEEIPASSGWHQVFGSVAVFLFLVQAFTGALLAFNYAPTPGDAYNSLRYILTELTGRPADPRAASLGRQHDDRRGGAAHGAGVPVRRVQEAARSHLDGRRGAAAADAGLRPDRAICCRGTTAPTGARWSRRRSPVRRRCSDHISAALLGGEGAIGVVTFARFYGMHVLLLPPATMLLIVLHVYLVRKHGVAPAAGATKRGRRRSSTRSRSSRTRWRSSSRFCHSVRAMAVAVRVPLEQLADPTDTTYIPRPEWYFLFLFQTLKLFNGPLEVVGSVVLPGLAVLALILVPVHRPRADGAGRAANRGDLGCGSGGDRMGRADGGCRENARRSRACGRWWTIPGRPTGCSSSPEEMAGIAISARRMLQLPLHR